MAKRSSQLHTGGERGQSLFSNDDDRESARDIPGLRRRRRQIAESTQQQARRAALPSEGRLLLFIEPLTSTLT